MDRRYQFIYGATLLLMSLAACAPQAQPTDLPASMPLATEEVAPGETADLPVIEPITLDLGDPPAGTSMRWLDDSRLVFVPGAEFEMGAGDRDNPAHRVSLASFWIQNTEVTNRMYQVCVAAGVCTPPLDPKASVDLNDYFLRDRPVVNVNWEQAQTYCGWINGTVPTEAQWELAARGLEGNLYPWGDGQPTCDLTNFQNCLGKSSRVLDHPDGRSPFNALDMAGNVFEWVGDWYDPDYYPNGPDMDPQGPNSGIERVVRGGGFESLPDDLASTRRFSESPQNHRADLGFRCVVQEPVIAPPFCETSAIVPGDPSVPPPTARCDIDVSEAGHGCGQVSYDIVGPGRILSAGAISSLTCERYSDSRVACSGPGSTTGVVSVLYFCGEITPGMRRADPSCLSGYDWAPGSEVRCEYVPSPPPSDAECRSGSPVPGPDGEPMCVDIAPASGETIREVVEESPGGGCAPGMTPGTDSAGNPVCRATTPDGRTVECSPGEVPVIGSDGSINCVTRRVVVDRESIREVREEDPCPEVGTYRSADGVCVGLAPGPGSTPTCLEGFSYNEQAGCCQAPVGGIYPGCGPDEVRYTGYGCGSRPDASGAVAVVTTFNATTGACGGSSGGPDCSSYGGEIACNAAGCSWDKVSGTCN
jgi:formylglycine-generating enzyme required for sulfatase activity